MDDQKPPPLFAVWNQLDNLSVSTTESRLGTSTGNKNVVFERMPASHFRNDLSKRSSSSKPTLCQQRSILPQSRISVPVLQRNSENQRHASEDNKSRSSTGAVNRRGGAQNDKGKNKHQIHTKSSNNVSNDMTQDRGQFRKNRRNWNQKCEKVEDNSFLSPRNVYSQGTPDRCQFDDDNNNQKKGKDEQNSLSDRCKKTYPVSFRTLNELVTRPANEILLKINQKDSGFMVLIKQSDIKPDMMALALIALWKACSATLNQGVLSLLNAVCNNTTFLLTSIQKYLVSFRKNTVKDFHLDSLFSLTSFLQKFQHTLPSSSSESVSILLPLLRSTCENFLKSHKLYEEAKVKLDEIQQDNEHFINEHTPSEIKKASNKEILQMCEPPEDFRLLSVLPTVDDIHSYAFLRPNIVEGKYLNTEQYLDIQYRLLREDYVRPLRNGIADYLLLKNKGKSVKNCRDVRVYENVHIVKQDFVNGGIVHIAQFSSSRFSNVKWEYSKRFLSGSLLCLSSDNFQTMLFASVARRVPEELKKGLLLIRFEDISNEVLNLTPLISFDVIETTAYFEAYRYNLKALQSLNEGNLPLKKYIVNVERTVDCPQYLKPSTSYDFRPLLLPIDDKYIKRVINLEGEISIQYEFPTDISNVCKSVCMLNDSNWPSASALNLDQSQYLALKAALTREFAIIQGPPGTGKTYIGLRIVQLLLHNIDRWFSKENNSLPILVVCFTNHALDQFLEGLVHFTDKIVRIGGRGTNDSINKYQLSNLKKNAISKKLIPRYISASMWQKNHELKTLKQEIDIINRFAQSSMKIVYGENDLLNVIPIYQLESLQIISSPPYSLRNDGYLIHDWLGIRSRMGWGDPEEFTVKPANVKKTNNFPVPEIVDDDIYDADNISIDEADIEFIEAQRDIDSEEFADVSFEIEAQETDELVLVDDSGWQTQGGRKERLKFVKNCLLHSIPLEEKEALKIKNVWSLKVPIRWQLYKFWIQQILKEKQEENMEKQLVLKAQHKEICEMRTEEDIFVLQKAHIVGMTTTGAAKYRDIVLRLNPQILIIEEAAEILESHIVTSLAPNTQHVILIGDHQQLRPSPTVHMLAVKYDLNISLFERMIKNQMECYKLSTQHRMRPEVAALIVPHIYEDLKNHEAVTKYENIKGVSKNVFFITHNFSELQENDSKSKINEHEAKFLIKLCKYFVLQGYDPSQITVLTTYSGQLFTLKKLVTDVIRKIRITVVDNFQGEENDIILISFVRSNEEGEIGFLKVANRVCVALSRAKKGLFCIGNFELLAEKSKLWKNINDTLQQKQAIGPSLQLMCQNHPGVSNVVANEKDFESVPEGGCTRPCEYRLACGHACSLMCHPYDRAHENTRCYKPCSKTCKFGHTCRRKCFEKCGSCTYLVDKTIFPCAHTIKIHCHMRDQAIKCTARCDKLLLCGHKCSDICSRTCSAVCNQTVIMKSPICGHTITVECRFKNRSEELMKNCNKPCNAILDCNHNCKGTCYHCHQGRLHVTCNQPCKRILVCGHECKAPCSKGCPACRVPCENRCIHSKCPKKCGEPCETCTEQCEWHCEHQQCSRSCGELCDRIPCNKPCTKLLSCGHPCIGFCGEPCPKQCRYCNSEIVKEIFFGTEDEDEARFVCLEDCHHILEISGLNAWMNTDNKEDHQVQMKACPKCKTIIRTNLRFGNVVKECLHKIETVKQKTFGNEVENKKKQEKMLAYLNINSYVLRLLKSGSLYESWVKILSSKRCRSIQEITTMENIFLITLKLANIVQYLDHYLLKESTVKEALSVLLTFMNSSKNWLIDFIEDDYLTASEQQQDQITWEIHRLGLGEKLLKLLKEHTINLPNNDFERCISILIKYSAFEKKDVDDYAKSFKRLAEACGTAVINITEFEKKSILKAMNLSVGHWYQCPNGHVYCITECGGAMQVGRCNECKAEIGGTNHALLNTNRVATDMDGARHAAWSEDMNMGNYP